MDAALEGSLTDVLAAASAGSDAVIVCVDAAALVAVVDAVEGLGRDQPVRVLAPPAAGRAVDRDQITAARLADLVASDTVRVRVAEPGDETCVVTDDRAVAVLTALPDETLGVPTTDPDAVAAVRAGVEHRWDNADSYEPSVPARTALVDSLEAAFDEATSADFERSLGLPGVRGLDAQFDLVELLVLVTARHRRQLYELTQWGSEAGVASVGTFSQAKRRLEDIGLVDTETIHSGSVGRPRQRLVLADESMADMDIDEFLAAARRALDE